jgi:hypothetical protein
LLGTSVLYCSKVATSGILPTNENCQPYADAEPTGIVPSPVDIDINIQKLDQETFSTKIKFPFIF